MKDLRNYETDFVSENCTSVGLSGSSWTYTYNAENRLIETQHPSLKTQNFSFNIQNSSFKINYEYSPLGKITRTTGNIASRFAFRFSSEYSDTETGLVYYNYRYYSPELGRWLSRDSIGEKGGLNLYVKVDYYVLALVGDLVGDRNIKGNLLIRHAFNKGYFDLAC